MAGQWKHIEMVVQWLNKFSPEKERVQQFLDESAKDLKGFNVNNETFLVEILSGCIEYKPLLDVVVNAFYIRDGKHCIVSERNLYNVVCYLATFQLEELGLQQFSKIVKSLGGAKICKVPETTYKPPRLEQRLKEIKLKNRKKAEDLLLEANLSQFSCAATKPEHESTIRNEIPKGAERFHAQKIQGKKDNISIKLNTAAILRENVLYQRKMEQELNRIEHLLRGARDPSDFLDWQKQMLENDRHQQLAEEECRRLEGKLSYEEAIRSRQNCTQENQKKAEQERLEEAEMQQQLKEIQLQEEREKKKLVQQVAEGHKNAKQALIKLQKYKHQIAQEMSEEIQGLLLQALEREEEQFKKRCELIQEIRAMEYVPFRKNKFVDLTQTGNHGFLGEMSVVELQERLALMKEAQKKAEIEKRDLIICEKRSKEQRLLDTLEQISVFREAFGRAAALKQEEKKIKPQFSEILLKDERVLDLQKKIAEKSVERRMQMQNFKSACMKSNGRLKKTSRPCLQEDHRKKLEESRQQQFKKLQQNFVSREVAQKMTAREAESTGTSACILRS
ncbi:cilia- and flagella-associated protein 99 isoform X3 [Sphaerodactylus townsendi]|uniref:cilia- and flagella-associated protein 99 isoform X3 n=1 Tax=Sphaerodactylus townsendi TaxID=933632 RepID=UPI002025DC6E|nr:cilia- and flagella-associated protein 99 isoform X3 [Sphaerodactylus townsendi]